MKDMIHSGRYLEQLVTDTFKKICPQAFRGSLGKIATCGK